MADPQHEFPAAHVRPAPGVGTFVRQASSKLWLVTLACLLVAAGLVWAELRGRGQEVVVTFAEGYGVEAGDAVRYRGIQVGEVRSVDLTHDLEGVDVTIELDENSTSLAREGTRFWVERPDIRLGQVRGLDTLVGGRYVGVSPGPADAPPSNQFAGLANAPSTIANIYDGLEISLESPQRFGLERGSPVSYRGVEVGHVASVGLANDAATVVARTFIEPRYKGLIRQNTRFWSNSGIDLRVGLSGLELDAETLSTIAAGGVAFATPDTPGNHVTTGHQFQLHKSPRDEWLDWQPRLAIGSASLPDDTPIPKPVLAVRRGEGGFSLFGRDQRRGWILLTAGDRVVGPADLLVVKDPTDQQTLEAWGEEFPLTPDDATEVGPLAVRTLGTNDVADDPWPLARVRIPDKLEEVVITCGSDDMTLPVLPERMTQTETAWQVDANVPVDELWHGASVIAASDGHLVGILIEHESGMQIIPLNTELVEALR